MHNKLDIKFSFSCRNIKIQFELLWKNIKVSLELQGSHVTTTTRLFSCCSAGHSKHCANIYLDIFYIYFYIYL